MQHRAVGHPEPTWGPLQRAGTLGAPSRALNDEFRVGLARNSDADTKILPSIDPMRTAQPRSDQMEHTQAIAEDMDP